MISWPRPFLPAIPGEGVPLALHDTATRAVRPVDPGPTATMYVCGITPYDATHLGHAATYVAFDLVGRVLRDNGHEVRYVQNVTDIDDPLLERATRDGVDWKQLAESQVALYREDMTALAVLPPDEYVGVVESMDRIGAAVVRLLDSGHAYRVPVDGNDTDDIYFDLATQDGFGAVSGWDRGEMLDVFAERGGDPQRSGKRDALDPLLWRSQRPGEPAWEIPGLDPGRPGWHLECTVITLDHLGVPFDVQGGGSDLIFPHHEMSAIQSAALTGSETFARLYAHGGMVGLDGEKMSKSRGNLVFVSALRAEGVDPMAIRLLLLAQHYRSDWEFTPEMLSAAQERLEHWREAMSVNTAPEATETIAAVRAALSDDLDSPGALAAVDEWADRTLTNGGDDAAAPGLVSRTLDALLGIRV